MTVTNGAITAKDIRDVVFQTARMGKGYKISEVDDFLDVVEMAFAELQSNLQAALDQKAVLESQLQVLSARLAVEPAREQPGKQASSLLSDTAPVELVGAHAPDDSTSETGAVEFSDFTEFTDFSDFSDFSERVRGVLREEGLIP